MSITDELRKWLDEYGCEYGSEKFIAGSFGSIGQDKLIAIADKIDAELAERYVALPLDADGVPLRVGDEIEYPNGARDTVRFATISPIGWAVNDRGWKSEAMRHHHEPTVLDTLLELINEYREGECALSEDRLAEYAAKLKLRGDGE